MNILKFRNLFFLISAMVLIPGLISLMLFGLKPGIDFIGGSLFEIGVEQNLDQNHTQQILELAQETYIIDSVIQSADNQVIIKGAQLNNSQKDKLVAQLEETFGKIKQIRFESMGPTLGKELLAKTIVAIILVSLFIVLYVWHAFKDLAFGVCAILAMFHDTFILLGIFSLLGKFFNVEVDILFVTAVLMTLSFSIHDTVVIFNRIRELRKKHRKPNFTAIANVAILETLARSVNNSLTIILMLLSLVVLGGKSIRWFSTALLIGAITGTYSSTFTAVPLLTLWFEKFKKRF